jgi:hypothetical protein
LTLTQNQQALLEMASLIEALVEKGRTYPSSRELSLALTKLEEASLWLTKRLQVETDKQE